MALTKIPGELFSVGDLDISDVGTISLDAIQGDADSNTSITFSGSDVITIATGGSNRLTIGDGALSPVTDNQIDLGTSSLEFKDAYFDGTVTSDAFAGPLTGDVTGNVSGTAATVTGAAQSAITSLGTLTTLTVDNVIVNGTTIGHTSDTDLMTLADGSLTVAGTLTATKLVSTNGVLELDDNGSHNGIINVPASMTINIDSDDGATNESFSIAKDKTAINDTDVLFRVQEDGKVGIGTASPAEALEVYATEASGGVELLLTNVGDGGSGTAPYTAIRSRLNTIRNGGEIRFGRDSSYGSAALADSNMQFYTALNDTNTERMRITSEGKVGIGDTAPQDLLEIRQEADAYGGLTISSNEHDRASLSFARSSTATARVYITEPNATHTSAMHFQTSDASGSSPNLITAMTISDSQVITMPKQPCFSVALPAATTSGSVIVWGGEHLDIGNNYNTSNGRFTAPIAGNYYFTFWILMDPSGASDYSRVLFSKNGTSSTQYGDNLESTDAGAQADYHSVGLSAVIPLSANDYVEVYNSGENPTYGTAYGNFSGFLVS